MKNLKRILISLLLLISILLSLVSCKTVLRALKGPVGTVHDLRYADTEIHWVETLEETLLAIEHLEAAGNKISRDILSSYDNEAIDVKYCFKLDTYGSKRLKKGQEWYDREGLSSVRVIYMAFLEEVSTEDALGLYISDYKYKSFTVHIEESNQPYSLANLSYVCPECHTIEDNELLYLLENKNMCFVVMENANIRVARIIYNEMENHTDELPENFHEEFIKTLFYIGEE